MTVTGPGRLVRAAAVTTGVLAVVYLARLTAVAQAASYLGVLAALAATLALLVAYRLWRLGAYVARMLSAGLAALTLAGQAVNLWVGLPGAHELQGPPGLPAVVGAGAATLTLVLLLADARQRARVRPADPYAL